MRHDPCFLGVSMRVKYCQRTLCWIVAIANLSICIATSAPPVAPTGLTATLQGSRKVLLQWQDNSDNETAFLIQRAMSPEGPWKKAGKTRADIVEKLAGGGRPDTTYYFRVVAVNKEEGTSQPSDLVSITIPPRPDKKAPVVALVEPVDGEELGDMVTFSATATDNDAVDKIEFYVDATLVGTATNDPYSISWDSTTAANGSHSVSAKAYDVTGNWRRTSKKVSVKNISSPTNLVATPISGTEIDLTWEDNSNNEDAFPIERATSADGPWSEIAIVGANVTSYADTGVQPETSYFYRVRACVRCTPTL
jgi:Bacterial Ig domain